MRHALLAIALFALCGCDRATSPAPIASAPDSPTAAGKSSSFAIEEVDIATLQARMERGESSSRQITQAYLDRIAAIDDAGPQLNAVIELNPDALKEADALDAERKAGTSRGPMHGIPVLLKDNIDATPMVNSAGSLALAAHRPKQDAFLVKRLRDAGAVILGKTNLSEWANFRSTRSSSGWSSRGGQTKNPYVLDRNACGSSAGTGTAIAASLAAVGIGTETDGSIICPASVTGLVGTEAHRRPGQPQRHHPDLDLAGHRRSDDTQRRRRGGIVECDGRRGRGRSRRRSRRRQHPRRLSRPPEAGCAQGQASRRAAPGDGLPPGRRRRDRSRHRRIEVGRRGRGRCRDRHVREVERRRIRGAAVRVQGWSQRLPEEQRRTAGLAAGADRLEQGQCRRGDADFRPGDLRARRRRKVR